MFGKKRLKRAMKKIGKALPVIPIPPSPIDRVSIRGDLMSVEFRTVGPRTMTVVLKDGDTFAMSAGALGNGLTLTRRGNNVAWMQADGSSGQESERPSSFNELQNQAATLTSEDVGETIRDSRRDCSRTHRCGARRVALRLPSDTPSNGVAA